jgi:hypothetical protein
LDMGLIQEFRNLGIEGILYLLIYLLIVSFNPSIPQSLNSSIPQSCIPRGL